jgi:hypothetical protein
MPQHRREALLWRYRHVDPARLDAVVRSSSRHPCLVPVEDRISGLDAALDQSGIWHLRRDGNLLCEHFTRLQNVTTPGSNWSDVQAQLRQLQAASAGPEYRAVLGTNCWIEIATPPALSATIAEPAEIRWKLRCALRTSDWHWPGYCGPFGKTGPMRSTLVERFGQACQACGVQPNECIDHDHATGIIRGLLCVYCNNNIDLCRHPSGCAYAEYLNDPPAYSLGLKHPKRH